MIKNKIIQKLNSLKALIENFKKIREDSKV